MIHRRLKSIGGERPSGGWVERRNKESYFNRIRLAIAPMLIVLMISGCSQTGAAGISASDPGVQEAPQGAPGAPQDAPSPLPGLTEKETVLFNAGLEGFEEAEEVEDGVGPRFNLDSCGGCHKHPAVGGTSPALNPQVAVATAFNNNLPFFVKPDGPVREARFKFKPDGTLDGGVHALFVISGHDDAGGCEIKQEDFDAQGRSHNLIFRIPTPLFGDGLIEQISDSAIIANQASAENQKSSFGIHGRPHRVRIDSGTTNLNGNDGTIARFGWKAQNKSLLLFSGEAYNVEMGFTNELFPTERDETEECQFAPIPNDATNFDGETPVEFLTDMEKFAFFMRFLAPPTPSLTTPGGADSIASGRALFQSTGCAFCHTPTLHTNTHAVTAALADKDVNLFSDLLLHKMGPGLADDIVQGQAGPDEFRTAPLWGLGHRIFLLHDGRTSDLVEAIEAHRSKGNSQFDSSEANKVVEDYNNLSDKEKQALLNFLRSL